MCLIMCLMLDGYFVWLQFPTRHPLFRIFQGDNNDGNPHMTLYTCTLMLDKQTTTQGLRHFISHTENDLLVSEAADTFIASVHRFFSA